MKKVSVKEVMNIYYEECKKLMNDSNFVLDIDTNKGTQGELSKMVFRQDYKKAVNGNKYLYKAVVLNVGYDGAEIVIYTQETKYMISTLWHKESDGIKKEVVYSLENYFLSKDSKWLLQKEDKEIELRRSRIYNPYNRTSKDTDRLVKLSDCNIVKKMIENIPGYKRLARNLQPENIKIHKTIYDYKYRKETQYCIRFVNCDKDYEPIYKMVSYEISA